MQRISLADKGSRKEGAEQTEWTEDGWYTQE